MARRLNTRVLLYLVIFMGGGLVGLGILIAKAVLSDQGGDPVALLAEAREQKERGEHQRALLTVRKAVEADPKNIEALHELSEIALMQEPRPPIMMARNALERVLAMDPTNFEARRDLAGLYVFIPLRHPERGFIRARDDELSLTELYALSRGRGVLWQADSKTALREIDALIELRPEYGLGHLWGGVIELHLGDDAPLKADKDERYGVVVQRCETGIQFAPGRVDLYRLMVMAMHGDRLGVGEDKMLEVADRAIENNPDVTDAYALKAGLLTGFGRLDEAAELLRGALEKVGQDGDVYAALGDIELRRRKIEQAEQDLLKAVEIKPDAEGPYLRLARLYAVGGQHPKRIDILQRGRRHLPEARGLKFELADAWLDVSEFEKAEALIADLDDGEDRTGQVSYLRGKKALMQRQARQAITHLLRAREKNPTPLARFLLGQAYLQVEELGAAAKELNQLLLVTPGLTQARALLADVRFRLHRYEEAIREADAILAEDPSHVGMRLLKARALSALGRHDAAVAESRLAIDEVPADPRPLVALAGIQMQAGRPGEAETALLQAGKLAQAEPYESVRQTVFRALAQLYRSMGQTDKLASLQAEVETAFPDAFLVGGGPEEVEQHLRRRLQENPTHLNRILLAELLFRTGRAGEAIPLLEPVIAEADPSSAEWMRAWRQAFMVRLAGETYDEAARLIEALRRARPDAAELAFAEPLVALQQGRPEEAAGLLAAALEHSPNSSLYFLLGQTQFRRGRVADGQAALRRCLDLRPQFVPARLLLGRSMAREGNYTGALLEAREGLRHDEDNLPLIELAAIAHAGLGQLERAVEMRERFAEALPGSVGNLMSLVSLYRRLDRPQDAEARLQQAYDRLPDNPLVVAQFADFYAATGRFSQGQALIERFVADHEEVSEAHLLKADFLRRHRTVLEAEPHYRKAFELDPSNPRSLLLLGEAYVQTAQWEKAERVFMEAVSTFPDDVGPRRRLAEIYRLQGKLDDAEKVIVEVLRRSPDDAVAMVIRGRIAALRRDEKTALDYFEKAAEAAPNYGEALFWKAVLVRSKTPREAQRLLGTIAPGDASFEKAVLQLADLNASAGLYDQAILNLRRGLDFRPQSQLIRRKLAELYMATGQYAKAAEEWQVIVRYAKDPLVLAQYGQALYESGSYSQALEQYEQARQLQPEFPQALVGEAACLYHLGRQQEARERVYAAIEQYDKKAWPRLALARLYELMAQAYYRERRLPQAMQHFEAALEALSNGLIDEPQWVTGYVRKSEILESVKRLPAVPEEHRRVLHQRQREVLETGLNHVSGSILIRTRLGARELEDDRAEAAVAVLRFVAEAFERDFSLMPEMRAALRQYTQGVRFYSLALYQTGKIDEAVRWGRMVWQLDPTDFANANNLAWILAVEKKELDEAEDLMQRALQLLRRNPHILDTAGVIAYLREEHQKAINYLRESIDRGETAEAHYHLGWVYEARQQPSLARQHYEKALEMGLEAKETEDCRKRLERCKKQLGELADVLPAPKG